MLMQGTNITMQNMKRMGVVLFPPPPEDLAKLLDAGFRDAHRQDEILNPVKIADHCTKYKRTMIFEGNGKQS